MKRTRCFHAVGLRGGASATPAVSNRRMRKTARTVVWEGHGAQSPCPHPIRCSAMKPEIIPPHSGRRLVGTLALHCPSQRLVGTLALQIMSVRSKNETTEHGQDARATPFHKARCRRRERPRSRLSALPFSPETMIFANPRRQFF